MPIQPSPGGLEPAQTLAKHRLIVTDNQENNWPASSEVIPTGIASLDATLGRGGFYRGSSILLSGSSGSGKTTIGCHFVDAACARGERCQFFGFEESTETAEDGATCALLLRHLRAAAACDLPDLVAARLTDLAETLPASGTLTELIAGLDLLEALRREHVPGTTPALRDDAAELSTVLRESAIGALPGLAGSDRPEDAAALVDLTARAGEQRLGLRLDDALGTLVGTGSPMMRGATGSMLDEALAGIEQALVAE